MTYKFGLFFLGIGFGQMHDKDGNKSFRFKTGVGFFGYLTYDYTTSFDIAKHNIGFIGVFPISGLSIDPM